MKTKIIISFIIFSLLITYIFPIISFGKYNNYTALGDSIPAGYYLKNPDQDNYAEKLRQKLNISSDNFKNLSISGETTKKLYKDLQTAEWTNAIASADLVTFSVGANELTEIVAEAFSYATGVPVSNDLAFNDKVALTFLKADLLTKIDMLTALYEFCTTTDFQKEIDQKVLVYEEYWKKTIDYVKQINPDITIVATEHYNPYYEISILNFDLGGFFDKNMQKLNTVLYNCSNSEKNYKIAKIYSIFNTTNPRLTYANLSLTDFGYDPHPTPLGHDIISLKILDALNENNTSQKDISTLSISHIDDQQYTGNSIEPEIIIKDGNTTLVQDKDYYVLYDNNVELGQASAIILGTGNYTGKVIKTFNIYNSTPKDISTCKINSVTPQIYLGINLEPEVAIWDGDSLLTKNKDYILKYQNNINIGIGLVTITGIGNYTGTSTTNFVIAPCPISITEVLDIPEQLYTGDEITPNVIVSFGTKKLIKDTDYTLEYSNNINVGTATVSITGTGNYTGTIKKEFNIVDTQDIQLQDISKATVSKISDKVYTSNPITPEVTVTLNGEILVMNTDYKAFYNNNINVGTANISIEGIGDYTGNLNTTFKIAKKSIKNLEITDISDQIYTGESITPQIVVSDKATKLKENVDYTVSYKNNTNIGLATIELTGKGNYTGSLFKTFNIIEDTNKEPIEDLPNTDNSNNNVQSAPGNIDNTVSNNIIPHAGTHLIIFISIILFTGLAIIFYKLYKRWF